MDVIRANGKLTPRKVLNILSYLPIDSATSAEMRGGQEYRIWNPITEITAQIRDAHYEKPLDRPDKAKRIVTIDEALPV